MSTWNSRGLRGSELEDMINRTNEKYREKKLALIQKIPTPITPVKMDQTHRQITLAYFEQRSTVDYIGAVQGIPVCFDAKECHLSRFPMQNVHEHQMIFMRDFEEQGGIAFFIIYFSIEKKYYYVSYKKMLEFWNRAKLGGKKHFKVEELDADDELKSNGFWLQYLEGIQRDLLIRPES